MRLLLGSVASHAPFSYPPQYPTAAQDRRLLGRVARHGRRVISVRCNSDGVNDTAAKLPAKPYTSVDGFEIANEELSSLKSFMSRSDSRDDRRIDVILQKGSTKDVQDLNQLEGAMLCAEQVYLANLTLDDVPCNPAALREIPVWQPVFASSGGVPRLLYIPVPEYFDLSQGENLINIVTLLGPVITHFSGTCSWARPDVLNYSINRLDFQLGKAALGFNLPGPLKLKNTLTFFFASDACACARSKLGGTMLLVPQPDMAGMYPKP